MKRFVLSRMTAFIICICMLAIFVVPVTASSAGEAIDLNRKGSVIVTLKNNDKHPIPGAPFEIYRVADMLENGSFRLTADFAGYFVSLEDLDAESMASLAMTLSGYIVRDGIKPLSAGVTNEYGVCTFKDIPVGLYIVTGKSVKMDETVYIPQPFMLAVPSADEDGNLIYDVPVDAKYWSRDEHDETPIERKVLKIWKDENGEERPHEIVVQLLKDGSIYDEVVLNAENNWRHTWSDLDPAAVWLITEKDVPTDYTVSVSQAGVTFTVTNKYNKPPEPTPTPPEKLPQTGQVWWPVPVLGLVGMVLCGIGIAIKAKGKKN